MSLISSFHNVSNETRYNTLKYRRLLINLLDQNFFDLSVQPQKEIYKKEDDVHSNLKYYKVSKLKLI